MRIHDKRMALVCFGLAAVIAVTGAASSCAKDANPPAIQQSEISEWAVEGDNIDLTVRTTDDIGVKEVFVQLDSGEKIPLTKLARKKDVQEISDWKASFKLPAKVYKYSVVARDSTNEVRKEGNITIYSFDADSDGIGYRDEIKYGLDPNKKNHVAKYLLDKNLDIYIPVFTYLDNDGVVDAQEKALIDLAIEYAPKITQILPGLYGEIVKLPDLSKIEEKDVEAIQDILILAGDPKYKPAFESMLNEGIKDKRKYCSPLEALLWIAYDKEFDNPANNPLERYSLEKMIREAWGDSSNNYGSNRWEKFWYEVIDRLNSPELVTIYLLDNISYDPTVWTRYLTTGEFQRARTPQQTLSDKKGACMDQSAFAFRCLSQNGYRSFKNEYDNFDIHNENDAATCILAASPGRAVGGHLTCLYTQDGKFYIIDAGAPSNPGKRGPFKTVEEAADATWPGWGAYMFYNGDFIITKLVEK